MNKGGSWKHPDNSWLCQILCDHVGRTCHFIFNCMWNTRYLHIWVLLNFCVYELKIALDIFVIPKSNVNNDISFRAGDTCDIHCDNGLVLQEEN